MCVLLEPSERRPNICVRNTQESTVSFSHKDSVRTIFFIFTWSYGDQKGIRWVLPADILPLLLKLGVQREPLALICYLL